MKLKINLAALLVSVAVLGASVAGAADDAKADAKSGAKPKPYPLKTCMISGDKLGEMGEPYVYVYEGQEIKFCCKGCLKDFKKDSAKYMKIIQEAEAKAASK
jgi:YHS domain-containing protein